MNGTWTRWAPLWGVLAPILWYIGVSVGESGDVPADGATADDILAYFEADTNSILMGGVLFMFGTLAFILFLWTLRGRWRAVSGAEDTYTLAFATGIIGAAFLAATWAPQMGIAIALSDMDAPIGAATAETAWHMGTGFFVLGELLLALFLFATAAVTMRVGVLPKWLAWIGVALGVIALIPPIGWAGIIFGLPIWLLLAAVTMLTGRGQATTPAT